jgi:dihydroorotase
MAAAKGGYFAVCTMPNLNPVPDSLENLNKQLEIIKKDSVIKTLPFGAITKGQSGKELSDMEDIAPFVCGFSDDGRGVDNNDIMREAMIRAKALDKIISAHCEDGSCVKDSKEAEWKQIERDIKLVDKIGCKYHVCHISTKESVELIRDAKKSGVNITCETAPHYLTLTDADKEDSGRFKMNPPLRDEADKIALIEGICDGTIDMIATDHAPHSAEEKGRGFEKSLNGIVGLETAFPVMYTDFVKKNIITLDRLVELMSLNASRRFNIELDGFTVYDLNNQYAIDPEGFATMGRSTPFTGKSVYGKCMATVCGGKIAYIDEKIMKNR